MVPRKVILCVAVCVFGLIQTPVLGTEDAVAEPPSLGDESTQKDETGDAEKVTGDIQRLYDEGSYVEAEKLARSILKQIDANATELQLDRAKVLDLLAQSLWMQGRYDEAEPVYVEALAILEKLLGTDHPETATTLNNYGLLLQGQGRYQEAGSLFRRALSIREQQSPPDYASLIGVLNNLADLLNDQGKFTEAERYFDRAIKLADLHLDPFDPTVADIFYNFGWQLKDQGRFEEAEQYLKRALEIDEKVRGSEHPYTAMSLNNLAIVLKDHGRYDEAEPLYRRALAIKIKRLPEGHPSIATSKHNLAELLFLKGEYTEAEPLYRDALNIFEKRLGPTHDYTAQCLSNIGLLLERTSRYEEAETFHLRAVEILQTLLGNDHPRLARGITHLADLYSAKGEYAKAEPLHRRAIEITETKQGANHPAVAGGKAKLSMVLLSLSREEEAIEQMVSSVNVISGSLFSSDISDPQRDRARAHSVRGVILPGVWTLLDRLDRKRHADRLDPLYENVFSILQLMKDSSVGVSVARGAAYIAGLDPKLEALVQERDGAYVKHARLNAELNFQLKLPEGKQDQQLIDQGREKVEQARAEIGYLEQKIREEFPKYASLAVPTAVASIDVQQQLAVDECVIAFSSVGKNGELIASVICGDQKLRSIAINLNNDTLGQYVTRLREGLLLPSAGTFTALDLANLEFDTDLSEDLYTRLIGPLEEHIKGAGHLTIVSDGPLQSLPFNLLVVDAAPDEPGSSPFDKYRNAEWFIDKFSLASVPTISSLLLHRSPEAEGSQYELIEWAQNWWFGIQKKPFFGVGDPALGGKTGTSLSSADKDGLIVLGVDNQNEKMKNLFDLSEVPQTGTMLRELSISLGGSDEDLLLRQYATEENFTAVNADGGLTKYQTIAFGTHALVTGEMAAIGLDEPALVLTPPPELSPAEMDPSNDGLLRSSEIVGLDLSADWVLLTACNTAASDGSLDAEPLSGLAKSFFYAGAKSLLVSHWPAEANATARLALSMIQESNRGTSKAQALRNAMRDMKQSTECHSGSTKTDLCYENAHPALWATFFVAGSDTAP